MLEAEGYPYTGAPPQALLVSRNKAMSKKVLAYHDIRVPRFVTWRPGEALEIPSNLRYPLIVKPLQTDASAGIAQASVVQDESSLVERVTLVHERFHQPAIAEEFVDGRELYVSLLGNGDQLDVLPITEMVFDKRKTRPEERIATKSAKWDEDYRARKGIRNVFARPLAASDPGADRVHLPHRLPRALAARLRPARRPPRPRRRGLVPRGQRQPLHQLRTRHGERGGEGRDGLLRIHPAPGGRGDGQRYERA